ncbi:hypothetical protein MBM09_07980 [Flaviramulus sp. BrNp1-15]|uniref:hypothetical protein n=1 Tax=Flaviramulus sp. BrNp1-15 TaxID=2916754 RepID=UPI001EE785CC|nr:hypothetical protein [Flaviramulus sp. BrNp1-15]ULC57858.1 hypothetical protein MBM09_07980 [Flaviramulus sp. BrNp1-15]
MKIEHLSERIDDYKASIETVVEKKILWKTQIRPLLNSTLNSVVKKYDIGWRVQELSWIGTNEAVNITFDSFPPDLIEITNKIPAYQFIQGAALVFSESYSGDVNVFILFPIIEQIPMENSSIELGVYNPVNINEKLIIEKVDEFLKEIIKWEVPTHKNKMGFSQ